MTDDHVVVVGPVQTGDTAHLVETIESAGIKPDAITVRSLTDGDADE